MNDDINKIYATTKDLHWLIDKLLNLREKLYVPGTSCDSRVFDDIDSIIKKITNFSTETYEMKIPKGKMIPSAKKSPIDILYNEEIVNKLASVGIWSKEQLLFHSAKDLANLGISGITISNIVYSLNIRDLYLKEFDISDEETLDTNSSIVLLNLEESRKSTSLYNLLYRQNILTIGDLISYTEKDLLSIRQIGTSSVRKIKNKLEKYGFALKEEK